MTGTPRKILRACALPILTRAARAYVAGPDLSDALHVCRWLSRQGLASTICFWNEDSDPSSLTAHQYLTALDALAGGNLDCYLSVKALALGFSHQWFAEIVDRARQGAIPIHFDSLGPEGADETFCMIAAMQPQYPRLGCTLPGRWRRSLADADLAVALGVNVRVVKGQWTDPEAPYLDPRGGFLAIIDRLAGRARHVGVATHDPPLAREALRRLRAANTPCQLELLFGLPALRAIREANGAGVSVRFYVPYGHGWLPYCLSQARRNPRILWWVLRDSILGRSFRPPARLPSSSEGRDGVLPCNHACHPGKADSR